MQIDHRINTVCSVALDLAHTSQLADAGVHRAARRRRVRDGRMSVVFPTVLLNRAGGHTLTREQQELAATLAAGHLSRLHVDTAAARLGMWDRRASTIHIASPRIVQMTAGFDTRFHRVHRGDTVVIPLCGDIDIACTDPLETIRCCGVTHTDLQIAAMLRLGVYERCFSLDDVDTHLRHARGLPGVAVARRGLSLRLDGSAGTKGRSEDRFHAWWSRGGYAMPLVNVRGCTGFADYEPDAAWLSELMILEIDGDQHYDDPVQAALDARRDAMLTAAGWIVVRVYWRRVWSELPRIVEAINGVLAARRHPGAPLPRLVTSGILSRR